MGKIGVCVRERERVRAFFKNDGTSVWHFVGTLALNGAAYIFLGDEGAEAVLAAEPGLLLPDSRDLLYLRSWSKTPLPECR